MKITAVVTVVVAFATAGAATQRRVRSGIINEDVETFRGSVELIGKDNTPVGALVFEQRGPDGAVSISGSLYGLPHGDYLSIAHDSSNYDGTCYSAGPPVLIEDLEYGGEDELFVFVPTETKGENNTLVKTSHSISLSPGDTYIGGQLILIHSVPSFESWETEESPTAYFSPDGACGFFMMDSPHNGKVPNVNTSDESLNGQNTSEETDSRSNVVTELPNADEVQNETRFDYVADSRRPEEGQYDTNSGHPSNSPLAKEGQDGTSFVGESELSKIPGLEERINILDADSGRPTDSPLSDKRQNAATSGEPTDLPPTDDRQNAATSGEPTDLPPTDERQNATTSGEPTDSPPPPPPTNAKMRRPLQSRRIRPPPTVAKT